jgi:SNF2 family DNA or RNA helicase
MNIAITGNLNRDSINKFTVHKVLRPGYKLHIGSECNDGRPITESWRYKQAIKLGIPIVRKAPKVAEEKHYEAKEMFVDKYTPKSIADVIGHKEQINQITTWLQSWDEAYPNESVKLEELTREIAENIGGHKALIFSQFLGMLALIKEQLKKLGIDHEYFDGSSTIQERERAIERFQNDDNCRVFLISLKAGGVGLNLTAADYVYIVDPWWNPAVEQQAIDRTHRIGQTKNIFAYRMICNDTVEDKILKLQERKRSLAKELISDEVGFVKSLTKDDIAYLFS